MDDQKDLVNQNNIFVGTSEMAMLMRLSLVVANPNQESQDCSKNTIGEPKNWSQSLKTAINIILGSPCAMFVFWGEQMNGFYNDACIPLLGKRHPDALVSPASEIFVEIWDTIGQQIQTTLKEGIASCNENLLLMIERDTPLRGRCSHCYQEAVKFTFSYSPIFDDDSTVGGVLCTCIPEEKAQKQTSSFSSINYQTDSPTNAPTKKGSPKLSASQAENQSAAKTVDNDSEARFQQMAQTIPCVFWLNDLQTNRLLYLSPAYEEIWGRSLEEIYTDFSIWIETIHPEHREQMQTAPARCLANNGNEEEYRIIRPDGSIRWIRDRGFVVRNPEGEPYRLAGVAEDITEQKQAAEILRENQARLKFVLDSSQIGEWDLDLTTQAYTTHRSLKHDQIFGYQELLPQWSYEIFLNHVHPDDRKFVDSSFKQTLSTYVDWDFECRIIHASRQIHWISARGSVYRDSNGNPIRLIGILTDITKRKRAEESLRESERRLRRLVESNMFGVVFGDTSGKLSYANDYVLNMIGYTSEEMYSGRVRWDELTPPEFTPLDAKAIQELTQKGVCNPYEKEYIHKDGRRIPILSGVTFLTEPYNDNQEVIAFVLNLTELKQITEERDRFFNLSLDMMAIGNLDGYFTQVNPAWEKTLGLTPAELTTQSYLYFVHPDDLNATLTQGQKLGWNLETIGFENRYRTKNGSYRWLSWNVSAFPEQNVLYAVARDITEQKQIESDLRESELNFRTLADAMPQIFWTACPDGWINYYNQRWYNYTGLSFEQTKRWGWQTALHPDDIEYSTNLWRESIHTDSEYNTEYRLKRASDGQYRWFLVRGIPLRDENGQIIKWFGSCTDIHDQKRAREAAEEANRIKDEFLAVLSHELRTPLNPILNWTKLLQRGKLNYEKTVKALASIERNAKLQVQLIEDLLDISRILQGKLSLNVSLVDLSKVIQATLENVHLAAQAKSLQIKTAKSLLVGMVNGDAGRLQQIVWNLLSNAIKFTPPGGIITVELTEVENQAQIQVKDNGKGIHPRFLPHVFEHFRQEDSATTRKFGGLGLGLAIVRQLIELHGGTVAVESSGEGKGAIFTVCIPISTEAIHIPVTSSSPNPSASLVGRTILIVDDEPDSLELIQFILEQEGATVTAVTSAAEALRFFNSIVPDLLISDIAMAEMDGYDLIQIIRGSEQDRNILRILPHRSRIKAIALTAYAGKLNESKAISAGFQRHLSKPIDPELLVNTIVELLDDTPYP
ncbi:MAG: PAS domain-containing protein [Cyanobacteria bacterium P01_A01_bin.84]